MTMAIERFRLDDLTAEERDELAYRVFNLRSQGASAPQIAKQESLSVWQVQGLLAEHTKTLSIPNKETAVLLELHRLDRWQVFLEGELRRNSNTIGVMNSLLKLSERRAKLLNLEVVQVEATFKVVEDETRILAKMLLDNPEVLEAELVEEQGDD